MEKVKDVILELKVHILRKYRKQGIAAKALGFTQAGLSSQLLGIYSINDRLLWDAGIVHYMNEYYWWPKDRDE